MFSFQQFLDEQVGGPYNAAQEKLLQKLPKDKHDKVRRMIADLNSGGDEVETVQKHDFGSHQKIVRDILHKHGIQTEDLEESFMDSREMAKNGNIHHKEANSNWMRKGGDWVDFYGQGTGDKLQGKVTKNDGKVVHIKDTTGKTHRFNVKNPV